MEWYNTRYTFNNVDPSACFAYKRKLITRPWNSSNKLLKFAQIEGVLFRISYRRH